MEDEQISDYIARRSRECRARAQTAVSPEERRRWIEMADYFSDVAQRWALPVVKKT